MHHRQINQRAQQIIHRLKSQTDHIQVRIIVPTKMEEMNRKTIQMQAVRIQIRMQQMTNQNRIVVKMMKMTNR